MSESDRPEDPKVPPPEQVPAGGPAPTSAEAGSASGADAAGESYRPPPWMRGATWLRGLMMLLFWVLYGIAEIVVGVVVLLQFLIVLFTGERNDRLVRFGERVSLYIYDVLRFVTFNSEERPFPFSDLRERGPRE
jgi:hypothetical protein